MSTLKFMRLCPDARIPEYETDGAAGMDVAAAEYCSIARGETRVVRTGLACEIPPGWELQCRPRSSLASKGLIILNSPGTIDSDYRGEIKIILHNVNYPGGFDIEPGHRIAQLVLKQVPRLPIEEVSQLSETKRGEGGFGSTGVK